MTPSAQPIPRPRLVVLVGPTGAGKSDAALRLAAHVGGEIVSADSQQVYLGMDIGTGKVARAYRQQIRHHLIDVVTPDQEMTAARFAELADAAIRDAHARGVPIIVAGGTGLYVRVLLFGLFDGPGRDVAVRTRLSKTCEQAGTSALWHALNAIDPASAHRIHEHDKRRLIRALEVHALTGKTMSEWQKENNFNTMKMKYDAVLVGISPPREILYARIDARVTTMMEQGFLAEVERLRQAGYGPELRSQAAIGYAELHAHLDGTHDLSTAIQLIQRNSRRYARRQLSWYRSDKRILWIGDASDIDVLSLERYLRSSDSF